jgi:hypothetical protein
MSSATITPSVPPIDVPALCRAAGVNPGDFLGRVPPDERADVVRHIAAAASATDMPRNHYGHAELDRYRHLIWQAVRALPCGQKGRSVEAVVTSDPHFAAQPIKGVLDVLATAARRRADLAAALDAIAELPSLPRALTEAVGR